jgi:hypothetical protein
MAATGMSRAREEFRWEAEKSRLLEAYAALTNSKIPSL